MSQTYELACNDCEVTLWIGQGPYTDQSEVRLYTAPEHIAALSEFLVRHQGHHLKFGNIESFDFELPLEDA